MNPAVITMDPTEAGEKADAYRAALARRNDPDYAQALTLYEALEQGLEVIDVGNAIREAGFDEKMRPKLALARADRHQVYFEWWYTSDIGRFDSNQKAGRWGGREFPQMVESINFNCRHAQRHTVEGYALVPMIPADVRPAGNAADWHILWEVEQWSDTWIGARADRDPYLLRRLAGDLFVILAEWDLTEVERLVTQGRARVQR